MKINVHQVLAQGIVLRETVSAAAIDLETEIIKYREPLNIKADITRVNNALTAEVCIDYALYATCSRCVSEFRLDFKKELKLNYAVDKSVPAIDLDPDIREEIILDYPLNPLCRPDCKGLCPKCGKNLNEGKCGCSK